MSFNKKYAALLGLLFFLAIFLFPAQPSHYPGGRILYVGTGDVANTSTSPTSMLTSGTGNLNLPANFFVPGKTVRVRIWGVYTGNAVNSLTWTLKLGSTALETHSDTTALFTGSPYFIEWLVTCRTAGASGSVAYAVYVEYTGSSGALSLRNTAVSTTSSVDTTTAAALDVTTAWSGGTVSVTARVVTVEVLN